MIRVYPDENGPSPVIRSDTLVDVHDEKALKCLACGWVMPEGSVDTEEFLRKNKCFVFNCGSCKAPNAVLLRLGRIFEGLCVQ